MLADIKGSGEVNCTALVVDETSAAEGALPVSN